MHRYKRSLRVGVAVAVAAGTVWLASVGTADADDPEVCGYVRYATEETGTSSTVPYIPHCERPCGLGASPSGTVTDASFETLICAKGL